MQATVVMRATYQIAYVNIEVSLPVSLFSEAEMLALVVG